MTAATDRERPDRTPNPLEGKGRIAVRLGLAWAALAAVMLGAAWVAPHVTGDGAMALERAVLSWFHGLDFTGVDRSMRELAHLSEGITITVMAILAALLLWRHDRATALLFPVAYLGPLTLHYLGKGVIGRGRPDFIEWSEHLASGSSYPSGHAMAAAAFYIVVGVVVTRRHPGSGVAWVWPLVVFLVLASGVNRLYLGVHWPTDVLMSWLLGAGWAVACLAVWKEVSTESEDA